MLKIRKADEKTHHDQLDQLALCTGEMQWIALVLTNDEQLATKLTRQSVAALFTDNQEFDHWLALWGHRITIKNCIAAKRNDLSAEQHDREWWEAAARSIDGDADRPPAISSAESINHAIRSLHILPRFVFVMHALEKYSLEETGQLLHVPEDTCKSAFAYALAALGHTVRLADLQPWVASHSCAY